MIFFLIRIYEERNRAFVLFGAQKYIFFWVKQENIIKRNANKALQGTYFPLMSKE